MENWTEVFKTTGKVVNRVNGVGNRCHEGKMTIWDSINQTQVKVQKMDTDTAYFKTIGGVVVSGIIAFQVGDVVGDALKNERKRN